MVFLDARKPTDNPTATAAEHEAAEDRFEKRIGGEPAVSQPIGTPATYENDGGSGLRKKAGQETANCDCRVPATVTENKTQKVGESIVGFAIIEPTPQAKYAAASLDYHFVVEQCRAAERAKDAAFEELLAASGRGDQWPEECEREVPEKVEVDAPLAETLKMPSTTGSPAEPIKTPDASDEQNELDADPPLSLGGMPSPPDPSAPPDPLTGSDWRSVTTRNAGIPEAMCILLKDQPNEGDSITTIGQLVDFTQTYELTNLARIGQRKSDVIVKAMVKFWGENPEMGAAYLEEFAGEREEGGKGDGN